jgi:hypothetical protein
MTVPSPPSPPAPAPAKKGLSPLAWVGIGCGALLVLGAIALSVAVYGVGSFVKKEAKKFEDNPVMAAAELMVRVNPDYELVSKDVEKNTLTIRNVKTGDVATLRADDVKEGRFSVTTEEGTVEADFGTAKPGEGTIEFKGTKGERSTFEIGPGAGKVPSWMPSYPRGKIEGSFSADTPDGRTTTFTLTTSDGVKDVLDFYERELETRGLAARKTSLDSEGQTVGGTVTGESGDRKRMANVVVSRSGGSTQAMLNVTEKP